MSLSDFAAVGCLATAALSAWVICKFSSQPVTHVRFSSLDGLRGYLAYFVFLHHSSIWYGYVRSGRWESPQSNLYNQFGQSSVVLFFMITAFLFASKLLDGKFRRIDWRRLYISRILRIAPLYFVAIFLMFILVASATNWELSTSIWDLCRAAFQWLMFTIKSNPDINGLKNTFTVIAGVTWSLPYEWLFYFSLPLMGLLIGLPIPNRVKVFSIAILGATLAVFKPSLIILSAFSGGIIAAILVRFDALRIIAANTASGLLILGCMIYLVATSSTAYTLSSILILGFVFVLIASGNTLFGVLTTKLSRTLGEMAYGIYLLHGLLLFMVLQLLIGVDTCAGLTEIQYWFVVGCLTPILISLSFLSYKYIEQPCINSTDRVLVWSRQSDQR